MSSIRAEIETNFPRPSSPELGRMAWGSFISSLGTTFQVFAFTYVVYATTKSALATVMAGVSFAIAFGIFALTSGKLAKRFDHRRVVAVVCIAKALIYAVILALQLTGKLSAAAGERGDPRRRDHLGRDRPRLSRARRGSAKIW